ncbi:hypothetical protein ACSAZK_04595 [Methanosarcina sp. Mfa9]|uniref:hypothetical protein n=1 Tax=Methanosarcina sp. Mfa9 TaxID=3439063 RepID=UPI003F829AD7
MVNKDNKDIFTGFYWFMVNKDNKDIFTGFYWFMVNKAIFTDLWLIRPYLLVYCNEATFTGFYWFMVTRTF